MNEENKENKNISLVVFSVARRETAISRRGMSVSRRGMRISRRELAVSRRETKKSTSIRNFVVPPDHHDDQGTR